MNLYPPLIIAAIGAIWWYLTGGNDPVKGGAPGRLPLSPSGGASFASPGTTGQPDNSFSTSPPAITVQPGTSSSGVPGTAPQTNDFINTTPGPVTANAPFQPIGNPIPLGGVNRPGYGVNRNVLDWGGLLKNLNPFNIPGSNTAPKKGGCGCSGNTSGAPTGCGGCAKIGSCAGSPPMANNFPYPNQLINIPSIPTMYVAQSPMTLASQVVNLSVPYMNPFTVYQANEDIADTNTGGVPASPTHAVTRPIMPPGPYIPY